MRKTISNKSIKENMNNKNVLKSMQNMNIMALKELDYHERRARRTSWL
jgi:hypothetical protein